MSASILPYGADEHQEQHLSPAQTPEYFTAHSGAVIAGVSPPTVRALIEPDAVYNGHQGKRYGLYTRETLETFAASRNGQGSAS